MLHVLVGLVVLCSLGYCVYRLLALNSVSATADAAPVVEAQPVHPAKPDKP